MNRTRSAASFAIVAVLCLGLSSTAHAQANAGQDAPQGKQPYTMAEYNSYSACANDQNLSSQVKCFDDFVAKYPNSTLLIYVYPKDAESYMKLKDYRKAMESADKAVALGDKIDGPTKYAVLSARAQAYATLLQADPKGAGTDATLAKGAVDSVGQALKYLEEVKKPDGMSDDQFAKEKEKIKIFLNGVGAQAAGVQKDSSKQIEFYKAVLAQNTDDVVTNYQLGKVYLAKQPPQSMDGFWYVARGAASKAATQQQKKQLTDYLRKLMVNYQQASCDSITDAELNELLQLAASSPTRPDTYNLASVEDLNKARTDMTIASVIADLKAGGDKSKVTWLASCGLEFPEVPGKALAVTPGADAVVFKAALVTSDEQLNTVTTPDMEVKVVGQPEAARVEKDAPFRFTATIASYDPDPAFMIHWDKGKVKAEDIPPDKGPAKKTPARRPPARKPATKPSA